MSPAHVLEPAYDQLKRALMQGHWPQGAKLEALRLADAFGVSMTPIRDCLNLLVGERLVEMKPGEGYRVARISEQGLRDMLAVNATLLDFALQCPSPSLHFAYINQPGMDYADQVSALFTAISSSAGNNVLTDCVRQFNERMHVLRNLEPQVFPDASGEFERMVELWPTDPVQLRSKLIFYHERRRSSAPEIFRLLR